MEAWFYYTLNSNPQSALKLPVSHEVVRSDVLIWPHWFWFWASFGREVAIYVGLLTEAFGGEARGLFSSSTGGRYLRVRTACFRSLHEVSGEMRAGKTKQGTDNRLQAFRQEGSKFITPGSIPTSKGFMFLCINLGLRA